MVCRKYMVADLVAHAKFTEISVICTPHELFYTSTMKGINLSVGKWSSASVLVHFAPAFCQMVFTQAYLPSVATTSHVLYDNAQHGAVGSIVSWARVTRPSLSLQPAALASRPTSRDVTLLTRDRRRYWKRRSSP